LKGKITDMAFSSAFSEKNPELSLGIFLMKTLMLRKIIEQANAYGLHSLTEYFFDTYKRQNYKSYCFGGYVATISSFLDYFKHSMELAKNSKAREALLGNRDASVFTRVHNSAPTVYRTGAQVRDSMIADDCVIEGTVIDSVLFRGVVVRKGAIVKNSVLFGGTYAGENSMLNCVVSVLTGSSFGTAATMGVICTTMAAAMGIHPMLSGGAVLAGAFFGDRCSPMSSCANLVAACTGTQLYRNVREMLKTALLPTVI